MGLHYLSVFSVTAALATMLTWMVERIAKRKNWAMSQPLARHIHDQPIPRLGGVAVFTSSVIALAAYWGMTRMGWIAGVISPQVGYIFLIGVAFFGIGLIDDFRSLKPWSKLGIEVLGGVALFLCGIHAGVCSGPSATVLPKLFCLLVTVGWVVLICNAVNLIDGIDGLAAGAALFSMITIFTLAVDFKPGIAVATAILGGSMIGFLIFNFNPATIFLGDSGSLFLGFVLSGLVLAESHHTSKAESITLPVLSFALPLTEVAISVLRRFLNGHALFGADREHIHHKLLDLGLTQRQAVAVLYGVSALCTLLAIMVYNSAGPMIVPVAGILVLVAFFGGRKLGYGEFSELGRMGIRLVHQKKSLAYNIGIRKAISRLNQCHQTSEFVAIMEECLKHDFDGYEIILEDSFICDLRLPSPWHQGSMEKCWRSSEESLSLKMGLHEDTQHTMGSITLFQNAKQASTIDAAMLTGPFRMAIASALENAIYHELPPRQHTKMDTMQGVSHLPVAMETSEQGETA
jgi:UDP-GlcNAc:undecaprenyl-phosphate/decaprenyl-phosphate GlcNAc-1-phosphate transferase